MTNNAYEVDPRDVGHLDTWLDAEIHGDRNRAFVRSAMLALAETDPEYWWSQRYWNWIDFGLSIDVRDVANGKTDAPVN